MSVVIRIVDGSTTVTFATATAQLRGAGYVMGYPSSTLPDSTVTESVTIRYPTRATGLTAVDNLGRMFEQAKRYAEKRIGNRVYVEFAADGSTFWRSELVPARPGDHAGRVVMGPRATNVDIPLGQLEITVFWTRRYYWEQRSETQLTLDNANGTATFLNVYNHDDSPGAATHNNWVDFSPTKGELPAPVRLRMEMQSVPVNRVRNTYVGCMTYTALQPIVHILETEDAGDPGGAPVTQTPIVDTDASGDDGAGSHGQYYQTAWTSASELDLYSWTITNTQATRLGGAYYKILARANDPHAYTDLYLRARIYSVVGSNIQRVYDGKSTLTPAGENLWDLGVLRLPPFPFTGTAASFELRISGHRISGAATTLDLDFIQLTPVEGGYRHYYPINDSLGQIFGTNLIDDMVSAYEYGEEVYQWPSGSTDKAFSHVAEGEPFMVTPGQLYRMYFLWDEDDGDHIITQEMTIRLFHRARRLTLGTE